MKKQSDSFALSKNNTEIIKGIAILLMLFHHLFGFPEWLTDGIKYIGIPLRANTLECVIGKFGHICVALFAFITGYGMYFSYKKGNIFRKTVKKGVAFLVSYWLIIFAIIVPISLALGKTDLNVRNFLLNMFGIENDFVAFAWYVRFYLAVLITLPFFYKLMTDSAPVTSVCFAVFPPILRAFVGKIGTDSLFLGKLIYLCTEYLEWLPCVLSGLCFAKYGFFDKIDRAVKRLGSFKPLCLFAALVILFYMRAYRHTLLFGNLSPDFLYAPLFIYIALSICGMLPRFLSEFLAFMGGHSMNIWFLHSVFFFRTSELMKYAYAPRVSLFIVAWVIALTLPVSYALKYVSSFLLSLSAPKPRKNSKIKKGTDFSG